MKFLIKIAVFAVLVFLISLALVEQKSEQTAEPREFIVSVQDNLDVGKFSSFLDDLTLEVKPLRSLSGNLHLVSVTDTADDAEVMRKLKSIPGVLDVEPNAQVRMQQ